MRPSAPPPKNPPSAPIFPTSASGIVKYQEAEDPSELTLSPLKRKPEGLILGFTVSIGCQ